MPAAVLGRLGSWRAARGAAYAKDDRGGPRVVREAAAATDRSRSNPVGRATVDGVRPRRGVVPVAGRAGRVLDVPGAAALQGAVRGADHVRADRAVRDPERLLAARARRGGGED